MKISIYSNFYLYIQEDTVDGSQEIPIRQAGKRLVEAQRMSKNKNKKKIVKRKGNKVKVYQHPYLHALKTSR